MMIDRAQMEAALPHYDFGETLGRGAHGLVFAARHRRLGSSRAVKALMVSETEAKEASRRFLNEAQVMTALDHPHIVRVHEYAEDGAVLLLVMEHLGGGTLTERMKRRVAPEVACAWMLALADALTSAHRRGVVHRDIKPANLLFNTDGVIKVGDFGIAKLFAGSDASASVDIVGTPRYVAPEQITGGRVGPATDLYALGVTFYELLSGRSPFPPQLTLPGLLHHHLSVAPRPLDDAPPALAELVLGLLAKNPHDRPASAHEFALALVRAADQDLGGDWIDRSGVSLRVDGAVLKRQVAAVGAPVARTPQPQASAPSDETVRLSTVNPPAPPGRHAAPSPPSARPSRAGTRLASRWRGGRWGALAAAIVVIVLAAVALPFVIIHAFSSNQAKATPAKASASPSTVAHRATPLGSFNATPLNAERLEFSPDSTKLAWVNSNGAASVWLPKANRQVGPLGENDFVWAVAFNPDSGDLISGETDGTFRHWDPATGRPASTPTRANSQDVFAVAVDREGTYLATGGADASVRLWDATTGEAVGVPMRGHTDNIAAVAFSPTGERLASAADDGIRLWNTTTQRQVKVMPAKGAVTQLAFSPDGTRLATGGINEPVRLWDGDTGAPVGAVIDPGRSGEGLTLGFSRDSDRLVTCAGNTIRWWDSTTGKQAGAALTLHTSAPLATSALNADSTQIALSSNDGSVDLWSLS
jgi:serine/threonine protein kinase